MVIKINNHNRGILKAKAELHMQAVSILSAREKLILICLFNNFQLIEHLLMS